MKPAITLISPDDTPASDSNSLVLMDHAWYPAWHFLRAAREVRRGPGVIEEELGGEPGYRVAPADDVEGPRPRIAFYASSDTHVHTFVPIAKYCASSVFIVPQYSDKGARGALERAGIPFEFHRSSSTELQLSDMAFLGNDWSYEERVFIQRCRRQGIPVLCLQESINVDFEGPPYRMQWADHVLIQGAHALRYLDRDLYFLTGNPRYDDFRPLPPPNEPSVLINVNFTFGIGVEWSRRWVESAIASCTAAGLPYRLSVHPRDETDLTGLGPVTHSSAYRIAEQMKACTVLVSRDSALPYEALLHNRHAIYFDPFDEKERCLREDDSGLILKAYTDGELQSHLRECLEKPAPTPESNQESFQYLFTGTDGKNVERVLRAASLLAQYPDRFAQRPRRWESWWAAQTNLALHGRLRKRLRRVPLVQRLWRSAKRVSGK